MDELKRCPFCGGEGRYYYQPDFDNPLNKHRHNVCCNSCAATTGMCISKEAAYTAWNLREYSERHNPKPLTLKRLQEIIESDKADNAIWVKEINSSIWTRAILDYDNDRGIFAVWHGGEDQSDFYIEADYYKTWLAYDYPPEEV